ncbi:MAG TPA: SAM-dependent methyltransferase [Polyangiales bacterium]|nr:SAM-dependent methyltransferase [Polyangiales bacterium]
MKPGRPSLTASYVALARAIATHDSELAAVCQDPWAERLLPSLLGGPLARAARSRLAPQLFALSRAGLLGMADHMAVRTRLIDEAVAEGVAEGARQLVLLGAGLDSRAHRLPALAESTVFEVDFPSTQAFKRERARALPRCARVLRYVPCDFEREPLRQTLLAQGFEPQRASVWVWEGVTMYLSEAAIASSLDAIAELSAPHSRLALTYLEPFAAEVHRALIALAMSALAAVSEPVHSMFDPVKMAQLLTEHGFETLSDARPRDIAARYGLSALRLGFGAPNERVAVAERRALT